jgi:hypothetical protein
VERSINPRTGEEVKFKDIESNLKKSNDLKSPAYNTRSQASRDRIKIEQSLSLNINLVSIDRSSNNNEMIDKDHNEMNISDPVQIKNKEADLDNHSIKNDNNSLPKNKLLYNIPMNNPRVEVSATEVAASREYYLTAMEAENNETNSMTRLNIFNPSCHGTLQIIVNTYIEDLLYMETGDDPVLWPPNPRNEDIINGFIRNINF